MFISDALSRLHIEVQEEVHDVIPLNSLQNLYNLHFITIMNIWHFMQA